MSILRLAIAKTAGSLSQILLPSLTNPSYLAAACVNRFSNSASRSCSNHNNVDGEGTAKPTIDPAKDRSVKIDVETSIRYLKSRAFKETYGQSLVWELYRRNHKGGFAPRKTRRACIKRDIITTGSPCPICRDQYLVLHHNNLELLHQFISPHTGEVSVLSDVACLRRPHLMRSLYVFDFQLLSYEKTNLCQKAHRDLTVAFLRAHDRGLVQLPVEIRQYDYAQYYKSLQQD